MSQTWPEVSYVERSWPPVGSTVDPMWSQRRRRANKGTYLQAQVPDIASLPVLLSSGLTADVQAATEDVIRFDAQYVSNAPFSAVLLRSESSASSQIEQLTANARRISLARLGDTSRLNATLIAKNTLALEAALQLSHRLDLEAMLIMHETLLDDSNPLHAGRLREEIVWIGGDSPVTAHFVPPTQEDVAASLEDLVVFMQRNDVPALAQAAIAHAQFETIHPFTDGNGRTGRALVSALLKAKGVTKNFTVPISSGLLTDTAAYFNALTHYRAGHIAPIIDIFVRATAATMGNAQKLQHDIDQLHNRILGTAQRVTKGFRAVAQLCITEPAFTAGMVEDLGVPISTVYKILARLVEHDILRVEHKIQGQLVWSVIGLTDILDDFARRAGRRA